MPAAPRYNRISALFVALLYVFLSTFGAVAHTHAFVEPDRKVPASVVGVSHPSVSTATHWLIAAQRDCAVCEWQALSVTQVGTPQPPVDSALLRMVLAVPIFSFDAVSVARFSSRAPPAA